MQEKDLIEQIFLGAKIKDRDPLEWAIENNHTIDGKDPIEWALDHGKEIDGKNPILWALDNNKTIEGKHPIDWLCEASSQRKSEALLTNDLVIAILKYQYPGDKVNALVKDYEKAKSASQKTSKHVATLLLRDTLKPKTPSDIMHLVHEKFTKSNASSAKAIAEKLLQSEKPAQKKSPSSSNKISSQKKTRYRKNTRKRTNKNYITSTDTNKNHYA